jgi:hypothetical protein
MCSLIAPDTLLILRPLFRGLDRGPISNDAHRLGCRARCREHCLALAETRAEPEKKSEPAKSAERAPMVLFIAEGAPDLRSRLSRMDRGGRAHRQRCDARLRAPDEIDRWNVTVIALRAWRGGAMRSAYCALRPIVRSLFVLDSHSVLLLGFCTLHLEEPPS